MICLDGQREGCCFPFLLVTLEKLTMAGGVSGGCILHHYLCDGRVTLEHAFSAVSADGVERYSCYRRIVSMAAYSMSFSHCFYVPVSCFFMPSLAPLA